MVRTKQGGSILSFAVVAITLVVVLVGAVWLVRNYNLSSLVGANGDAEVAQQEEDATEEASPRDVPASEAEPAQEPRDDVATNNGSQQAEERREQAPAATTDNNDAAPTPEEAAPSAQQGEDMGTLPQTGPMEWVNGISAGLFVGALLAYAASRRQMLGL